MTPTPEPPVPVRRADRRSAAGPELPERSVRQRVSSALLAVLRLIGRDEYPQAVAASGAQIQQSIGTGRRIAVVAPEPGIGASTVTELMATAIETFRRDLLAVIDLSDDPTHRSTADGEPSLTPGTALGALAVNEPSTRADFRRTMRLPDASRRLTIGTEAGGPALTGQAASALLEGCTRHCAFTIVECPADLDDERTRAALTSAHAVICVTDASSHDAVHTSFRKRLMATAPNRPVLGVLVERHPTPRSSRRTPANGEHALPHAPALRAVPPISLSALPEAVRAAALRMTAHAIMLTQPAAHPKVQEEHA